MSNHNYTTFNFIYQNYTTLLSSGLLSANNRKVNPNTVCQKSNRSNMSRKNSCRRQPVLREKADNGKRLAIEICQQNFLDRKWNCTTSHSSFRRIMKTGRQQTTAEKGELYAVAMG